MKSGSIVAGRFELGKVAGSGAMGVVFRAIDRASGEPVAVKILRPQLDELAERFAREAEVLRDLRHPGIVSYIAHGRTDDGDSYLAMEWLEGETLTARLKQRRLTRDESVDLVLRVAEALHAAHERGIVHRDIKPGNLFLQDRDLARVRLLDFGIAHLATSARQLTMSGVMLGTPGYMSPEQARGARDIDARSDVFALGCLLFRCIAGRTPFVSDEAMSVLLKVVLEDAPALSSLDPDAPPLLDALVARMLAKSPQQRPADAGAVASELAALRGAPTDLAPSSIGSPSLTTTERRVTCLVLASARERRGAEGTMLTAREHARRDALLRAAAAQHQAELEVLADGSFLVALASAAVATDLAGRAARCALAMRAALPGVPMALVTGRAEQEGASSMGELIERGVRYLRQEDVTDVRLDDVTAGLLGPRFDVGGDAAGLSLRGERRENEAGRTLLGRHTPCVGRERELSVLSGVLDECKSEPLSQVALVTGAAGIGKSRLRSELLRRVREGDGDVEVWLGRADPLGAGAPFAMIGEAVRRAAGIAEGEPIAVQRQKLRARLGRHVAPAELARVTEFMGEIAGVPFPDDESVQLRAARQSPVLRGDQMRRAWEDTLAAECERHPLVLVLEDLHWGDRPSIDLIDTALRRLPHSPLMVLALARPEVASVFPSLWPERRVQAVRLGELTRKACEGLAREVLGETVGPRTIERIVERAGGNAFYLEELIRAAAEGQAELLPETVVAMVQARLEGLPAEARRVLRAASVFGRTFWRGGVAALLGPRDKSAFVGDAIAELVARELVVPRPDPRFPGEQELSFRQALVREAAYAMLTDRDRKLGHRLAARWLERAGETNAMAMAEHLERGAAPGRSIEWYERAARQALGGNDLEAAIARADRAIEHGASGALLGELWLIKAEAHRFRGANGAAENSGLSAMRELEPGSASWCEAVGQVAAAAGKLGEVSILLHVVDELEALPEDADRSGVHLVAAARAAIPLLVAGRYDRLEALLDRIARHRPSVGVASPEAEGWLHRARSLRAWVHGDIGAYLASSEASAAAFLRAGDVRNACSPQIGLGIGGLEVGHHELARRALDEALAQSERLGLAHNAAVSRHHLGVARARQGALTEARALEESAIKAFRELVDPRLEGAGRIALARMLLASRELFDAEFEAVAATELLAAWPPLLPYAKAALAEVLLSAGRPREALAAAREASSELEAARRIETGESLVRRMLAETLFVAGERDAAAAAILDAKVRLLARADRIEDAALRASFLERVPDNARTLGLAREWTA